MYLNELRDKASAYAEKQGFHENYNFAERLMLVVAELSEALEAHRKTDRTGWAGNPMIGSFNLLDGSPESLQAFEYEHYVRGTVEEELADAVIRICDLAGIEGIDLEWHVRAKMSYNETRPFKHGKRY